MSSLGVKYAVDAKSKKITIGEVPTTNKYSMGNPAPIRTKQTVTFKYLDTYTADVTVKEIIKYIVNLNTLSNYVGKFLDIIAGIVMYCNETRYLTLL